MGHTRDQKPSPIHAATRNQAWLFPGALDERRQPGTTPGSFKMQLAMRVRAAASSPILLHT